MPKHIVNSSYFAELGPGTLTIKANVLTGFKVVDHMSDPTEVLDVVVTVAKDVIVMSDSPDYAAISGEGLAPGSTLTVINNGFIIGCGGRGGSEESLMPVGPYFPEDGQPGGDAIFSSVDLRVSSSFGLVWGGGGGGGGYRYNDQFIPGCGGAGRTTLGAGGDVGAHKVAPDRLAFRTAVPFTSRVNSGGAGRTPNSSGQDGASQQGGYYGEGGSPYMGSSANIAPSPGPDTPYLTTVWTGGGEWGCPGYSCAVAPGRTFTWIDDAPTVANAIKGLTGVRPDGKRPYKSRHSKFFEILITQDTVNLDVFVATGRPTKPISVFVYVAPGVTLSSATPTRPALTTAGMPDGSFIFLKNKGVIVGKGGQGGSDPSLVDPATIRPREGQPGGDAVVFTIDGIIQQHPAFTFQNGPILPVPWSVIAAGGGGGGYVRGLPFENRGYGGHGGSGGGLGGLGPTANGRAGTQVLNLGGVHNGFNGVDTTGTVWAGYENKSTWLNTQARGGQHGCTGQASTSKLYANPNPAILDETHLGGPGGWAVVSTKSLLMCLTRCLERNNRWYSNWSSGDWTTVGPQTNEIAFIMGRSTHKAFSNTAPQAVRPPLDISTTRPVYKYLPISASRSDFVLAQEIAGVKNALGYIVVVQPDVILTSTDVTKGAIEMIDTEVAKACVVVNFGVIAGRGGDGGGLGPTDDPNAVPVLDPGTVVGRKANGQNGGPAIRYSFNTLLLYSKTEYFINQTLQTGRPLAIGGGGGGAGLYLAEYVRNNGNAVYGQLIPESVRLALGGGGGAGGGAGGRGSQGIAASGGINVIYTSDNLWNSQEGAGYGLQYSIAGRSGLNNITHVSRGGNVGAGAPNNWPIAEASLSMRQQIPINPNTEAYPETAVRGVYGTGSRGAAGVVSLKVAP